MPNGPTTPPPVVINHPLLFAIGTGLWAIALALVVALDLMGMYRARVWIAVCAVGVFLGLVAVVYTKFSWRARRGGKPAP
jgi:polyferredoxin